MHLVQLLLPLYDNGGEELPRDHFDKVRHELTDRFGGVTAFLRAPAEGHWKDAGDVVARDEVVIVEVMVDRLDPAWWRDYRCDLESRFRQRELVVRACTIERL